MGDFVTPRTVWVKERRRVQERRKSIGVFSWAARKTRSKRGDFVISLGKGLKRSKKSAFYLVLLDCLGAKAYYGADADVMWRGA
jgi:hypothetical protein